MSVLHRAMQDSERYDRSEALHFADHSLSVRQFSSVRQRRKTFSVDRILDLRTHCVLHVWVCREQKQRPQKRRRSGLHA